MVNNSIEEALQAAVAEIELKDSVILAEVDQSFSEDKPGNYVRKRLNVLHKVGQGDYTYSSKELYINKGDFSYLWHYGGSQIDPITTPFRDLLESKIPVLKSALGVDYVEIAECDEIKLSGTAFCIKGTTGNLAETWTIKVWKIDESNVGFKIIAKTTVS